jgi:hypothetical protein
MNSQAHDEVPIWLEVAGAVMLALSVAAIIVLAVATK